MNQSETGMKWFDSFQNYCAKPPQQQSIHPPLSPSPKVKVENPISISKTQESFLPSLYSSPTSKEPRQTRRSSLLASTPPPKPADIDRHKKEMYLVPRRAFDISMTSKTKHIMENEKTYWRQRERSQSLHTKVAPDPDSERKFLDYGTTEAVFEYEVNGETHPITLVFNNNPFELKQDLYRQP